MKLIYIHLRVLSEKEWEEFRVINTKRGRGETPRNSWWGVCRLVVQIMTLFQIKKCHCSHPFQTRPLKSIPFLRPGLKPIMSPLVRLESQQKRCLKIKFEFAYFSFFLIHLELKRWILSYPPVAPLKDIPYSRPNSLYAIPVFRQKRRKNHTLRGGKTYMAYIRGYPQDTNKKIFSSEWLSAPTISFFNYSSMLFIGKKSVEKRLNKYVA